MKSRFFNVKTSYTIIFLTLVFWAFFAYFTMNSIIVSQKSYAKIINISGKQRMLSQKTALMVHKVNETSDMKFLKELQKLTVLMKNDHYFLISNLTSSHMEDIYFNSPYELDKKVTNYFKLLDGFIEDSTIGVISHIENYAFELLPQLNYAVNEFELESEAKIKELEKREMFILVGTLLTLLLEVLFIMLPTLRVVRESKKNLETYNQRLKDEVAEKTKAIELEHQLSKNYLDTMNSVMVVLDSDAKLIKMNKYGLNKLGFKAEDIIGKNWFEIGVLPEGERKRVKTFFKQIISGKRNLPSGSLENQLLDKNGDKVLFTWSNSLLKEDGKIVGIVSAGIDITTEKNQERIINEQTKLASMGEMIGNIAHQWRQPLSVISTSASGAKVQKELGLLDDAGFCKYMDNVIEQSEYLSKTIDIFRDFIKEKKELKEVVLQERVDKALQIIKTSIKNSHITLINNIHKYDPIKISLVLGELSQVIINIINNSKDAIWENKTKNPWIKIDLIVNEEDVTISIEDNGGGIPNGILDKIFNPYFNTKHQTQGTGLGLHMSYKIVTQSLHGDLYAKNSTDGAIFYIKLPLR